MYLTPELIKGIKDHLNIQDDFIESSTVTANDELFKNWVEYSHRYQLPKLIFYIIMDETFGPSRLKDHKGCLGRSLEVKQTPYQLMEDWDKGGNEK